MIIRQKKKWVIIPIEIQVRDLNSRLLIAVQLIKRGYGVILGSHIQINRYMDYFPEGIYFDKSIAINKYAHLKKIKKNHTIISLDEEGLSAFNNYEKFISKRVSKKTLELTSLYFSWGEAEKKMILDEYPDLNCKICSSGSPRFDFYKPHMRSFFSDRVKEIKNEYGDYIFISSNFSLRDKNSSSTYEKLVSLGRIKSKEDHLYYQSRLQYQERLLDEFIDLIKLLLANFSSLNFILRPHPSETVSEWEKIFNNYDNVKIIFKYTSAPWMIGSKVILHSSCTSGLEAFLLDKPVISYLPDPNHDIVKALSNQVSFKFQRKTDINLWIKNFLKGDEAIFDKAKKVESISDYISILDNNLSSEIIAEQIDGLVINKKDFYISNLRIGLKKVESFYNNQFSKTEGNILHKFPPTDVNEIRLTVEKLVKLLNLKQKINVNKIDTNLFVLT